MIQNLLYVPSQAYLICNEEDEEEHKVYGLQQAGLASEGNQQESPNNCQHPVHREKPLQTCVEMAGDQLCFGDLTSCGVICGGFWEGVAIQDSRNQ